MENSVENKIEEKQIERKTTTKLVIGIQYRKAGKIYTFATDDETLLRGEHVVVESEHGTSFGEVILPPQQVLEENLSPDLKKVLRRATPEELQTIYDQNERELEIFDTFTKKVSEHHLLMKPVSAELRDGNKKVILTFFAEERVDFRSLVKDLATSLHMRIEMRQIGARDEVKCRGGIGTCGYITCCFKHLRQFQSISIQMAKNQGLAPNPAKLTGICGKLKCCLSYENALYCELKQKMPRVGMLVTTHKGNGKITSLNILREQCLVKLEEGSDSWIALKDIKPQVAKKFQSPVEEEKKEDACKHSEKEKREKNIDGKRKRRRRK